MSNLELIYLAIHGMATLGAILIFVLRIEHRITRLETKMEYIEKKLPC